MDFEQKRWYQVSLQMLALACSFLLLHATATNWGNSFSGILVMCLCADGLERVLKAIGSITGALITSRR